MKISKPLEDSKFFFGQIRKLMKWASFFIFGFIDNWLSGNLSDHGLPKTRVAGRHVRDAVQDCLGYDVDAAKKALKSNSSSSKKKNSDGDTIEAEKFSGSRNR